MVISVSVKMDENERSDQLRKVLTATSLRKQAVQAKITDFFFKVIKSN